VSDTDRHVVVSTLVLVAQFVAYWALLSVGLFPLALVLSVLDVPGLLLVGGANLGLATIAVDREVGLGRVLAFSLSAIVVFLVLVGGSTIRVDRTVQVLVVVAAVAYAVAGLVVRAPPFERVREFTDPGPR
jgi:Mn2+/Fe2+ NRAMP family transporter